MSDVRARRGPVKTWSWAAALTVVLAMVGALLALPASADPAGGQGTFTGTVLLPDGSPAAGVAVQLSDAAQWYTGVKARTTTAADGTYTVAAKAGGYLIQFVEPSGDYLWSFHNDGYESPVPDSIFEARSYDVAGDETVRADHTLIRSGSLRGRITLPADADPADVFVTAFHPRKPTGMSPPGIAQWGKVAADGTFVVPLREGRYDLEISHREDLFHEMSLPVRVNGTAITTNDVAPQRSATISGVVKVPSGSGTTDVRVTAHLLQTDWEGNSFWSEAKSVVVKAGEPYRLAGLSTDNYRLEFAPEAPDSALAANYWPGVSFVEQGTDVLAVNGHDVANVDGELAVGGQVTGNVDPAFGLTVDHRSSVELWRQVISDRGEPTTWQATTIGRPVEVDGSYRVSGVPAGRYRLKAIGPDLGVFHPAATTVEAGADFDVALGETTSGIDVRRPAAPPSPSPSPTASPTPTPSASPTPSPGPSPTPTSSPNPSPTPTVTSGPTPTAMPTPTVTPSPTPTVGPNPNPKPTPKKIKRVKAPKVTGKAKVGRSLKVSKGTWKPKSVKVKYQWFTKSGKKAVKVKAGKKSTLKLKKSMRGKRYRVVVTVSKKGYKSVKFTSKWSKKVKR